ncbi:unnamed protein product [Ectocarpus fasciculatus]
MVLSRRRCPEAAVLALLTVAQQQGHVRGHLYQFEPASRQVYLSPVYQEWPFERMEYCPSCYNARGPTYVKERGIANTDPAVLAEYGDGEWPLRWAYERGEMAENGNYLENDEIAKRHGICGDPEQNEEEGANFYSTPNGDWPILNTYQEGQVLQIKLGMTAYHWGHVEFFICNADEMEDPDGIANQECFNKYPLTRAEGDGENSPIDPNYPGRYYVDPECREDETEQTKPEGSQEGYVIHASYQLPEGLTCERCILQMVYYTGNACKHVGYEEFEPASWPSACAPAKEDWIELNRYVCGENGAYPEEFWACADFAITPDGVANPTPAPTEPLPDCLDPVGAYDQCGGEGYEGSDCCREGYECTQMASCYSQCRPIPGGCSEEWDQCGGTTEVGYWEGPTCCWPGASCVEMDRFWSSCVPDDYVPDEE